MRSHARRVSAAASGALATPLAALAAAGGSWTLRRGVSSSVVCAAWLAGYAAVIMRPWPPSVYAPLLLAWGAAAGLALALFAPEPVESSAPQRPVEKFAVLLPAGLCYAGAVVIAVGFSTASRIGQTDATSLFTGDVFLWSLPALGVGGLLGAYWSRVSGPASGRLAISALGAAALVCVGTVLVAAAAAFSALAWGLSPTIFSGAAWGPRQLALITLGGAVFAALSIWAGAARSVKRVLLRCLAAILIAAAFLVHALVLSGLQSDWDMRVAWEMMESASAKIRLDGVDRLRTAFAVRPETPYKAVVLWDIAAETAAQGRQEDAERALQVAASLPEDELGQQYVRRARALLADHRHPLQGRPADVPGTFAVEKRPYLDDSWRGVIGLWRASLPKEGLSESLAKLQQLSTSEKRIRLPRLGGWAALSAYTKLYHAPVVLGQADLDAVRRLLASGRPVLVKVNGRFLLVIGQIPAFRSFRFIEYSEEPPWLTARLSRAEDAAAVGDDSAARLSRLALLQRSLVDVMPEGELAQALADSSGLCAWPGGDAPALDAARSQWLLGEAAMTAGDPVGALGRYERAWEARSGDWILPYVRAASLDAARNHSDIAARFLDTDPVLDEYAAFRRDPRGRALVDKAAASVTADDAPNVPSPALWRLTRSLDRRSAEERPVLAAAYAELARRFPDDASALGGLAEMLRSAGDDRGWRTAALQLWSLNPKDSGPLLDAVEASLDVGDAGTAARLIGRAGRFDVKARGRRLALRGRLELLRGKDRRALDLLEAASSVDRSDPDIHRDIAKALDALGRRSESIPHWRWVAQTSIDPADLRAARQRLQEDR